MNQYKAREILVYLNNAAHLLEVEGFLDGEGNPITNRLETLIVEFEKAEGLDVEF